MKLRILVLALLGIITHQAQADVQFFNTTDYNVLVEVWWSGAINGGKTAQILEPKRWALLVGDVANEKTRVRVRAELTALWTIPQNWPIVLDLHFPGGKGGNRNFIFEEIVGSKKTKGEPIFTIRDEWAQVFNIQKTPAQLKAMGITQVAPMPTLPVTIED